MTSARLVVKLLLIATIAGTAGCQTERVASNDGLPLPPKPKKVKLPPPGALPREMMLLTGNFNDDTDGNGYPDLLNVSSALRADESITVPAEGSFTFTLWRQGDVRRQGAEPIAVWVFGEEATRAARAVGMTGIVYKFRLNLLDVADDRMPSTPADIRASFLPAGKDESFRIYTSDEVRSVRVGRD